MRSFQMNPRHTSVLRFPLAAAVLALAAACSAGSDTTPLPDGGTLTDGGTLADGGTPANRPTLTSTSPLDGATLVGLNVRVAAAFDRAMSPLSATTFLLKQGTTAVAGTVTAGPDGATSIFTPSANLAPNAAYTATIAGAASSVAGDTLGADQSFSFMTGSTADTTPPVVTATSPNPNDSGVPVNTRIAATFNKGMDPASVTSAAFTVMQGSTPVAGTVAYGSGNVATFTPSNPLTASTLVTATLGTGLKDLQGNALANAYSWTFTTGTTAAKGPAPVLLGTAGNFVILAKTAISSVPASVITGDIGVSPAAATYLTGFSLVADSTNVFSTSPQITGKAYAANYAAPTPSNLTTAVGNMQSAYTDAAGRPTPDFLELSTGNIGGKTLAPGLYKWTSAITIPGDVTISGGANDTWIFQTTGDLSLSANQHVNLAGGAQAKNIVWQVAGKGTFGAGSHFEGVLLCKTQVTLETGSTMNGRLLAQTQVALQKATVTKPAQ